MLLQGRLVGGSPLPDTLMTILFTCPFNLSYSRKQQIGSDGALNAESLHEVPFQGPHRTH